MRTQTANTPKSFRPQIEPSDSRSWRRKSSISSPSQLRRGLDGATRRKLWFSPPTTANRPRNLRCPKSAGRRSKAEQSLLAGRLEGMGLHHWGELREHGQSEWGLKKSLVADTTLFRKWRTTGRGNRCRSEWTRTSIHTLFRIWNPSLLIGSGYRRPMTLVQAGLVRNLLRFEHTQLVSSFFH